MIAREGKSDGAGMASVHFGHPTSSNLRFQAESMVVVFATEPNGSVFQLSLWSNLRNWTTSAGLEVNLATIGINFVATPPWPDVNHIGA